MESTHINRLLLGIVIVLSLAVVALLLVLMGVNPLTVSPENPDDSNELSVEVEIMEEKVQQEAPLFFSTMTHLEGDWDFVEELEAGFDRQAGYLRVAMDYAETYDAILTFESEMPFARAMVKWDDNIFQEALDRGMGIGTHCDTTPRASYTDEELMDQLSERKALIDAVVDSSENLGCAGAGGKPDWYAGMVGAGFKYINGIVGFHYLAMPLSARPAGWTDQAIYAEYFHDAAPEAPERYYPFRINRVGFEPSDTGDLVVSAGDIGEISSIGDKVGDSWDAPCSPNCEIDEQDVAKIVETILEFNKTRDRSRVAKMQVYIATQKFSDPGIELFFQEMQRLQNEGVIEWASQKEVYETFVAWEQ